ncbi:hypothetical protein TELCIR_13913 [Teladorsagia circumcincta]|uniref:Uncharacterized protein n=1 Tax=Teladorsagia circumcincta TaxID=45464 RepID=A0A2G9U2H0_TELCI|nr:hypothetical protein TELCIR_13913 [Teladorsagia circumcincta]
MVGTLVKHHCLCGAFHVQAGARILSVMYLVGSSANLLNSLGFISGYPGSPLTSLTAFIIAFALTYGVFAERRYFIIPFLLLKALVIIITSFGLLLWMALVMAYGNRIPEFAVSTVQDLLPNAGIMGTDSTLRIICIAVLVAIVIVLMTYIYLVFFDYYVFLKEREEAFLNDSQNSAQYSPIPAQEK